MAIQPQISPAFAAMEDAQVSSTKAVRDPAAMLVDGAVIGAITPPAANGKSAGIRPYGATPTPTPALITSDRSGSRADISFGYDDEDLASGHGSEVLTIKPGIPFHSGSFLVGSFGGKQGQRYRMGNGIAAGTTKASRHTEPARLYLPHVDPGMRYRHAMIYRLSTQK